MKRVVSRVRVPASGLLQRQHIVFLLRQPCNRMLHLAAFPASQEQDDALVAHFVQRSVPSFCPEGWINCFLCSGQKKPELQKRTGAGDMRDFIFEIV